MSGGWTANDRVIVRDNIIRGNNYLHAASFRVEIGISTANDILGGNSFARTPPQV
jgi:hypothetical protein